MTLLRLLILGGIRAVSCEPRISPHTPQPKLLPGPTQAPEALPRAVGHSTPVPARALGLGNAEAVQMDNRVALAAEASSNWLCHPAPLWRNLLLLLLFRWSSMCKYLLHHHSLDGLQDFPSRMNTRMVCSLRHSSQGVTPVGDRIHQLLRTWCLTGWTTRGADLPCQG